MDDPEASQDLRRLGAQLISVNERNETLIEGLLVLAESDRGLPGKVPVRLDQLAGSVLDSHQEIAGKHKVTLHRSLAERLVPGDPLLLERLIGNLVTNAIIYNKPGGWVEVEVAAWTPTERGPALAVRNTGPHVPAQAVSSLFEPFRVLTTDRANHSGGAGLGMSIARSITTAHDGTIQARQRSGGRLDRGNRTPGRSPEIATWAVATTPARPGHPAAPRRCPAAVPSRGNAPARRSANAGPFQPRMRIRRLPAGRSPAAARQIRARELAAFGTRTPRSAEWFGQARTRMLDGNEYLDFNLAD